MVSLLHLSVVRDTKWSAIMMSKKFLDNVTELRFIIDTLYYRLSMVLCSSICEVLICVQTSIIIILCENKMADFECQQLEIGLEFVH